MSFASLTRAVKTGLGEKAFVVPQRPRKVMDLWNRLVLD